MDSPRLTYFKDFHILGESILILIDGIADFCEVSCIDNLADFQYSVGIKYQDFIQSLVTFPYVQQYLLLVKLSQLNAHKCAHVYAFNRVLKCDIIKF